MEVDEQELKKKRALHLGFQPHKELVYNKLLPYADQLDNESKAMFAEIKANLGKSIALREIRPACGIWTSRLGRYIQLYGFKFTKEDHIALVKLMYQCITIPNLEPYIVHKFAQTLYLLLRKKHLISPDELTLEWRPLYEIVRRIMDTSHTQLGMYRYFPLLEHTLNSFIRVAQYYFPETATKEILDEFRPNIYPLSGNTSDLDAFDWFLPMALPPSKAHLGYKLWLSDIIDMWSSCSNGPSYELECMSLVARVASENIGMIDWEPYMADMFAKFIAFFNLPVNYQNQMVRKTRKLDVSNVALWIVSTLGGGSSCQTFLDKFLKATETYFHPANSGRWLPKLKELLFRLPQHFVQRLRNERYRKPSWMNQVPDSHKLTEEDIDRFVDSVKPVAMQAIFSKIGCSDVCVALQFLASLRPRAICPDLIDKFYLMINSLTEPHKLQSIMQAIAGVARPLVEGPSQGYVEGPSHVIPLLMACLPGIDPNDFRKSLVTFQLIQMFVTLVPLIDCSKASETWSDLTEEEEEICRQTANLEDFVCQFFDKVFILVDSSTLESTRMDKNENKRSQLENLSEKALSAVCYTVLTQTSPEIFQSALKKLVTFVTERILETQVAGRFIAALCSKFARCNSVETFKALLPILCDRILALSESDDVQNENDVDNELLYNLLVLSQTVECRSEGLLPYMDKLTLVLDRCLHLMCREGHNIAADLLGNILQTLTMINVSEHRSLNYEYITGDTKHLHIREWGKEGNVNELEISWHVPTSDEVAAAQSLLTRYLPQELDALERHMSGEDVMKPTRLLMSLNIVYTIFNAEAMLPLWEEPPVELLDSVLPSTHFPLTVGSPSPLTMPNGDNVRHVIALTMDRLQRHLLRTSEDNTEAFTLLIKIAERLLLNKLMCRTDHNMRLSSFVLGKKILTNPLGKGKRRLRMLMIERSVLLHEGRCEKTGMCLTATHKIIMLNMLTLACSHYSQVRTKAQLALAKGLDAFPYSYNVLIPRLVENLRLNSQDCHETIKGTLYVLLGPAKSTPVVARHNWSMILEVWPAIIRCMPSEKLSVVQLMESLKDAIDKHFPTITIHLEVPDRCIDSAMALWKIGLRPSSVHPSNAEIDAGQTRLAEQCKINETLYTSLLDVLSGAAEDNTLHWRHHNIAICLIRDLVHPDVPYPPRVVKLFLDTLINDSIELRKIAIRSVVHVLKQQKRTHPKRIVNISSLCSEPLPERFKPGIRPDNLWLQYDSQSRPTTQQQWDQPRYLHRPDYGYLQMPRELELYAPSSEQPRLDRSYHELTAGEKAVHDFFSNEHNVAKFVKFLSLEERKGKDKFNGFRFILFKGLFRNHGDHFLRYFQPHLDQLVNDVQESSQRCATEIIAGVIRGSKHWPFEKLESLWSYMLPLIEDALTHITEETMQDWGICIATACQNRDPNRNHWLLEFLMVDPMREETSFMSCGRLYMLQSALNQQEWRVSELMDRLLRIITPFLDHPFEIVRRRIASVLSNIFQPDTRIADGTTLGPKVSEFMNAMLPRLQILYNLQFTSKDQPEEKSGSDVFSGSATLNVISPKFGSTSDHPLKNLLPDDKLKMLEAKLHQGELDDAALKLLTAKFNQSGLDGLKLLLKTCAQGSDQVPNGISGASLKTQFNQLEPSADSPTDAALRLFKTLLQWISNSLMRSNSGVLPEYYAIYPLTCLLMNYDQDEEIKPICTKMLAGLSALSLSSHNVESAFAAIQQVAKSNSWWARSYNLEFLKVVIYQSMPVLRSRDCWAAEATSIVLSGLGDPRIEVREKAAQVLAGLLHCDFIDDSAQLLEKFSNQIRKRKRRLEPGQVAARHSAVLGLCAFINSSPYDVPDWVPHIFAILGNLLNDPQPIPSTIRKTLGDFKRTHHDNWECHKLKFTEEELDVLSDLTVPPSYCN